MQGETINLATLPDGTIFHVKGEDLVGVRWVRETQGSERSDGLEPLMYNQFAYGGRSFTIDSNDPDSIAALKDRKNIAKLAKLTLEAASFEVPATDDTGNTIEGEMATRKSWRFVSLLTFDQAKGFANAKGELAAIEQKYAAKDVASVVSEFKKLSAMVKEAEAVTA